MDHYSTLGLTNKASIEDIKKAYRSLAKKWHPDKNGGSKEAEDKFKSISDAYAILSDPTKKQQYDARSNNSFKYGFDDFVNSFSGSQFNDWRKKSNDRARQSQGRTQGMHKTPDHLDITVETYISIREAFAGKKIELEFTRKKISYDSVQNYFLENEEKTIAFDFDLKTMPLAIKEENGKYTTTVRLSKLGNEEMQKITNVWGEIETIPLCGDALIKILLVMEQNVSIEEKNVIHRVETPFVSSIIENEKIKVEAVNGKKYEASLNYPKNLSKIEFSVQNEGLAISKTERGKYIVKIDITMSQIEEMSEEIKSQIKNLFEPAKG
jgi:DnaJ-class molecular chaperone